MSRFLMLAVLAFPLQFRPVQAQTLPVSPTRTAGDSTTLALHGRPRPLLAVLEVTATNVVIQRFNWWVRHADWADITSQSLRDNIRLGWEWDVDQFQTNMFGHPWGGGYFFNAGRDNGLSFWGSTPLT